MKNKPYLRFAFDRWHLVEPGKTPRPFKTALRAVEFCNKNKIEIRNKGILLPEYRKKLKY